MTAQELREAQYAADLPEVLSTPAAQRVLRRWLGDMKLYHTTFTGEATSSAFAEGTRAAGLCILADIGEHCPQYLINVVLEEKQDAHGTKQPGPV